MTGDYHGSVDPSILEDPQAGEFAAHVLAASKEMGYEFKELEDKDSNVVELWSPDNNLVGSMKHPDYTHDELTILLIHAIFQTGAAHDN